jgi:hypothetical protein
MPEFLNGIGLKRRENIARLMEVAVMQATAPSQFPYTLDGVEFWTVRRQEVQPEIIGHLTAPRFVETSW